MQRGEVVMRGRGQHMAADDVRQPHGDLSAASAAQWWPHHCTPRP
jgi:hypothetical protein